MARACLSSQLAKPQKQEGVSVMSETRYFVMHNLGEDGQDEMFELDFERGKEAVELMEQLKYPVSDRKSACRERV